MKYRDERGILTEHIILPEIRSGQRVSATLGIECDCGYNGETIFGFITPENYIDCPKTLLVQVICCPRCKKELAEIELSKLITQ